MRRVTKPGARRRGSSQEIVVRHDAGSRSPKRTAAANDIGLLGHGCGETIPSLRRISSNYRLETNGERLYPSERQSKIDCAVGERCENNSFA
jgi:hypothetical protein